MEIRSHDVSWRDPESGDLWRVSLEWAVIEGRLECVGVCVRSYLHNRGHAEPFASQAPRPAKTGVMRSIPFSSLIAASRSSETVRTLMEDLVTGRVEGSVEAVRIARHHLDVIDKPSRGRPGPVRYDREHFEEVARVYLEADGHRPTESVAEHWGVTRSAAAKWVARARRFDPPLLPPTKQGRATRRRYPERTDG